MTQTLTLYDYLTDRCAKLAQENAALETRVDRLEQVVRQTIEGMPDIAKQLLMQEPPKAEAEVTARASDPDPESYNPDPKEEARYAGESLGIFLMLPLRDGSFNITHKFSNPIKYPSPPTYDNMLIAEIWQSRYGKILSYWNSGTKAWENPPPRAPDSILVRAKNITPYLTEEQVKKMKVDNEE